MENHPFLPEPGVETTEEALDMTTRGRDEAGGDPMVEVALDALMNMAPANEMTASDELRDQLASILVADAWRGSITTPAPTENERLNTPSPEGVEVGEGGELQAPPDSRGPTPGLEEDLLAEGQEVGAPDADYVEGGDRTPAGTTLDDVARSGPSETGPPFVPDEEDEDEAPEPEAGTPEPEASSKPPFGPEEKEKCFALLKDRLEKDLRAKINPSYTKPGATSTMSKRCCSPTQIGPYQLHAECWASHIRRAQGRGLLETPHSFIELMRCPEEEMVKRLEVSTEGHLSLLALVILLAKLSRLFYPDIKSLFRRLASETESCDPSHCFPDPWPLLVETAAWLNKGSVPRGMEYEFLASLHDCWSKNKRVGLEFLKEVAVMRKQGKSPTFDCQETRFEKHCKSLELRENLHTLELKMHAGNREVNSLVGQIGYLTYMQQSLLQMLQFGWRLNLGRLEYIRQCLERRRVVLEVDTATYMKFLGPESQCEEIGQPLSYIQRGVLTVVEMASRLAGFEEDKEWEKTLGYSVVAKVETVEVTAKAKDDSENVEGVVSEVMEVVERSQVEADMADLERDTESPLHVRAPADNLGNAQPVPVRAGRRRPRKNRKQRRPRTPSPGPGGRRSQSTGSHRGDCRLGAERRSPTPRPFHDFMRYTPIGRGSGRSKQPHKKNNSKY